jgi:hypothetical protein
MEARGFGRARACPRRRDLLYKGLVLLGLIGVLCGLFLQTYYRSSFGLGWTLSAAGSVLLLVVFWAQGRRVLRIPYRRERWTWRDGTVIALCVGVGAYLVFLRMRTPGSLAYSPFQKIAPAFDPLIGGALMLLLVPLTVRSFRSNRS